jgi:hypothetical protein
MLAVFAVAADKYTRGLEINVLSRNSEQARYTRVLMKKPTSSDRYILSESEVNGIGGFVSKPSANLTLTPRKDGGFDLGSSTWRLQRDSLVNGDGTVLSKTGYQDSGWIPATVPATVLSSYWNIGAIPDPNYGDNQLGISKLSGLCRR